MTTCLPSARPTGGSFQTEGIAKVRISEELGIGRIGGREVRVWDVTNKNLHKAAGANPWVRDRLVQSNQLPHTYRTSGACYAFNLAARLRSKPDPNEDAVHIAETGVGACDEFSALAKLYLLANGTEGVPVFEVKYHYESQQVRSVHVYVLIGDLRESDQAVVVDPWVLYAAPSTYRFATFRNPVEIYTQSQPVCTPETAAAFAKIDAMQTHPITSAHDPRWERTASMQVTLDDVADTHRDSAIEGIKILWNAPLSTVNPALTYRSPGGDRANFDFMPKDEFLRIYNAGIDAKQAGFPDRFGSGKQAEKRTALDAELSSPKLSRQVVGAFEAVAAMPARASAVLDLRGVSPVDCRSIPASAISALLAYVRSKAIVVDKIAFPGQLDAVPKAFAKFADLLDDDVVFQSDGEDTESDSESDASGAECTPIDGGFDSPTPKTVISALRDELEALFSPHPMSTGKSPELKHFIVCVQNAVPDIGDRSILNLGDCDPAFLASVPVQRMKQCLDVLGREGIQIDTLILPDGPLPPLPWLGSLAPSGHALETLATRTGRAPQFPPKR